MGEDLKNCNIKFKQLIENMRRKRSVSKNEESLAYLFFIAGFSFGSGNTQEISA
jgi:hypothetical protein